MSAQPASRRPRIVLTVAAVIALAMPAMAERTSPYVNYSFSEKVRTPDDHREIATEVYLRAGRLTFSHSEWVSGAITPAVTEIDYRKEFAVPATKAQQARLIAGLRATGIFSLKDDPDVDSWSYYSRLYVDFEGEKHDQYFNTPPVAPQRAAAHKAMLDFIGQWDLTPPAAAAVRVSEGDRVAARPVTLAQLLADPQAWDGKRVAFTGYVHLEFEGDSICAAHDQNIDYGTCLWYGNVSDFAERASVTGENDSWQRVQGVFVKGPGGHMGLFAGEIQRLTATQTVPGP